MGNGVQPIDTTAYVLVGDIYRNTCEKLAIASCHELASQCVDNCHVNRLNNRVENA